MILHPRAKIVSALLLSTVVACATDTTPPRAPIRVADDALMRAYQANELAADHNYKDEPVEVAGTVTDIGKDLLGRPYLILSDGIQAVFPKDKTHVLAALEKGRAVKIRCICRGRLLHVQLDTCTLVTR